MSKPAELITNLKTLLSGNATLSAYVKQFLLGTREIETITLYPTIMLEPIVDEENDSVYQKQENHFRVQVIGLINVPDKDKQIVGDANTKGILDVVNDVKLAIDGDRTLSGKANHIAIGETSYSPDLYPVRQFTMLLDIWYDQIAGTRT
jgi:hypothetical protein